MAPDGICGTVTSTDPWTAVGATTGDGFVHYYDVCDANSWDIPSAEDIKQQHRDLMLDVIAGQKRQKTPFKMAPPRPRQQTVWKPQNF